MHKLTNDRLTWGRFTLLAGGLILALVLLVGLHSGHRTSSVADGRGHNPAAAGVAYGVTQRWLGGDRNLIRVYNRLSGVTAWECTVRRVERVDWSPDRRALALIDAWPQVSSDGVTVFDRWRLHSWRVGEQVSMTQLHSLDGAEVIMNATWSPDHERLLLLVAWGMGNADMGELNAYCIRLRDGQT